MAPSANASLFSVSGVTTLPQQTQPLPGGWEASHWEVSWVPSSLPPCLLET